MEYVVYHIFYFLVLVFLLAMLEMIVKRTASHLFEFQQQIEVCMLITP